MHDTGKSYLRQAIAKLARERFAQRADEYDREARFPRENFDDLQEGLLLAPSVPAEYGGHGLGPGNDAMSLWMLTKEIAKADMSTARCWEGHLNSQVLITHLATEAQKERWFEGIVERGDIWVAWSGEPQTKTPGQKAKFGTEVQKVRGGYIVSGTKVFATSAGSANKAILLVNPEGPGGARHGGGSASELLMLVCDLSQDSISFDDSWWDPIGMRGTVSYLAKFENTFIPDEDVLGTPGQYLLEGWQTRFAPHYGSTFLGGAEAAYDYAVMHAKKQPTSDPYVETRLGEMSLAIESAHLWLQHVSDLWDAGKIEQAKEAGNRARFLLERYATETVDHCIRVCGARSLVRPSPIERILRDLSIYVRHDNADQVLATIGRGVLGNTRDVSFANPDRAPKTKKNGSSRPHQAVAT